MKKIRICDTSV